MPGKLTDIFGEIFTNVTCSNPDYELRSGSNPLFFKFLHKPDPNYINSTLNLTLCFCCSSNFEECLKNNKKIILNQLLTLNFVYVLAYRYNFCPFFPVNTNLSKNSQLLNRSVEAMLPHVIAEVNRRQSRQRMEEQIKDFLL